MQKFLDWLYVNSDVVSAWLLGLTKGIVIAIILSVACSCGHAPRIKLENTSGYEPVDMGALEWACMWVVPNDGCDGLIVKFLPDEALDEKSGLYYVGEKVIKIEARGSACLANTAYMHELMHMRHDMAGFPIDYKHEDPTWAAIHEMRTRLRERDFSCEAK